MHCEVSASHSELSLSLRVGTTASHDVFLLENNFSQVAMITQSWVTLSLNFIICSYLDLCCSVISSEHISLWLYIIQSYNFIAFISSSSYFNFAWSYFLILLFFTIGLWWSLLHDGVLHLDYDGVSQTIMSPEFWIWWGFFS